MPALTPPAKVAANPEFCSASPPLPCPGRPAGLPSRPPLPLPLPLFPFPYDAGGITWLAPTPTANASGADRILAPTLLPPPFAPSIPTTPPACSGLIPDAGFQPTGTGAAGALLGPKVPRCPCPPEPKPSRAPPLPLPTAHSPPCAVVISTYRPADAAAAAVAANEPLPLPPGTAATEGDPPQDSAPALVRTTLLLLPPAACPTTAAFAPPPLPNTAEAIPTGKGFQEACT